MSLSSVAILGSRPKLRHRQPCLLQIPLPPLPSSGHWPEAEFVKPALPRLPRCRCCVNCLFAFGWLVIPRLAFGRRDVGSLFCLWPFSELAYAMAKLFICNVSYPRLKGQLSMIKWSECMGACARIRYRGMWITSSTRISK